MPSRAEHARDQWAVGLATITIANGYRTDLQVSTAITGDVANITLFPHVGIELGRSRIKFSDSARTVNDELVDLHVAGYVKADTETSPIATAVKVQDKMQDLIHDLAKKISSDLLTVNVNNSVNKWNIELGSNELVFERVSLLYEQRAYGIVTTELVLRIRDQDSEFGDGFVRMESDEIIEQENDVLIEQEGL